jgi:hypothetical protein
MRVNKSWPVRVCSENNNCMRVNVDWILQPLSYNISGGSARLQKVKPKTWRIFTFADARMTRRHWSQILVVITTEQGSFWARYHFHIPLIFAKIFQLLFWSLPSLRHFNICFELHKWQESSWLAKDRERIFKPQ